MSLPSWLELIKSEAICIEAPWISSIDFVFDGKFFHLDLGWLVTLQIDPDDCVVQVTLRRGANATYPNAAIWDILEAEGLSLSDSSKQIEWSSWMRIRLEIRRQWLASRRAKQFMSAIAIQG